MSAPLGYNQLQHSPSPSSSSRLTLALTRSNNLASADSIYARLEPVWTEVRRVPFAAVLQHAGELQSRWLMICRFNVPATCVSLPRRRELSSYLLPLRMSRAVAVIGASMPWKAEAIYPSVNVENRAMDVRSVQQFRWQRVAGLGVRGLLSNWKPRLISVHRVHIIVSLRTKSPSALHLRLDRGAWSLGTVPIVRSIS